MTSPPGTALTVAEAADVARRVVDMFVDGDASAVEVEPVMTLDLLWWLGWLYFAAWTMLPLVLVGVVGPILGVMAWVVLAPWSALIGMAVAHRLLPASEEGTFRLFADRGSFRWALKGWAPSVYLSVFQPVFFLSPGFQRIALRAFEPGSGQGRR